MQELDLSLEILGDILDQDQEFGEALKKKFQADPNIRPFRKDVAGLVGCELRHDLLFRSLLKPIEGLEEADVRVASLAMADLYFYRHFASDAFLPAVKEKLGDEKMEKLSPLFVAKEGQDSYIPETIKRGSPEYLSLRYNTPDWVLKIWEHFGYTAMYKTLRRNSRPKEIAVRVRESAFSNVDEFYNSPDFRKCDTPSAMAIYTAKTPLRKNDFFRLGKLFEEKRGIKAVFDQYTVKDPEELFLYFEGGNSAAALELIERYGAEVGLNIGTPNADLYPEIRRLIRDKGLHNVNFFSAASDSCQAAISKPQDLVIDLAKSSDFDAIRESPDFFVHHKPEQLDGLIASERASLENLSKHVERDGRLLYMVLTMNKKEGKLLIQDFLSAHPEFKLEKEEQFFPFDALDTALYYAVLHHEPDEEKAIPPLVQSALMDVDAPLLRAASK